MGGTRLKAHNKGVTLKKTGLLNQPLSSIIAGLGHGDMLVVADAGLPIPREVPRIDLALRCRVPTLMETLEMIQSELQIERVIVAQEMDTHSPHMADALKKLLSNCPIEQIPHSDLKKLTHQAIAVVRTGECTPFTNVILVAGVIF
jgi:D-ribose pyranase